MRIRFHAAGSDRPKHRVGELLRKRSDALGRQDQACALGKSLDAFSGFAPERDRKSTRLNSSHVAISYAVFCLKKKKKKQKQMYILKTKKLIRIVLSVWN